jgi:hypothetical protein
MSKRLPEYLPLNREGDFWVRYKVYNADGTISADEYKEADLTPRERDLTIKELDRLTGTVVVPGSVHPYMLADALKESGMSSTEPFAKILDAMRAINPETGKSKVPSDVIQQVYRIYMDTFPAKSIRNQFRKRSGTPGYQKDMLHVLAVTGPRLIRGLVNMEKTKQLDDVYESINKYATENGEITDERTRVVLRSIASNKEFVRSPHVGRAMSAVGQISYFQYILGNIGTALMNTMTLPVIVQGGLGGEYGHGKASDAMTTAMRMFFTGGQDDNTEMNLIGTNKSLGDKTFYGDKAKANQAFPQKFIDLFHAAENVQVIGRSVGQDMAVKKNAGKLDDAAVWPTIKAHLGWVFQNSERFNREVTLLASYMLATDSGMSHENAIQRAIADTEKYNGSASAELGPQLFQKGIGRIIGTFKRYPLNMMHLQAKLFKTAFAGASRETQELARKQLISTVVLSGLVSGIHGVPLMGAITFFIHLVSGIFGDDDEPLDPIDEMNDALSSLITHGVVGAVTGISLSRAGLSNFMWRDNPGKVEKVGVVRYAMETLLGPIASIVLDVEKAANKFNEGKTLDALTLLAPTFMRNIAKGVGAGVNGIKNSSGVLLADVNVAEALMMSAGITPFRIQEIYDTRARMSAADKSLSNRRTAILAMFEAARNSKDPEDLADAREAQANWNATQRKNRAKGKPNGKDITGDSIEKSRNAFGTSRENQLLGVPMAPGKIQQMKDYYGIKTPPTPAYP